MMATVIGDDTDITLEFTAFEIDLMREIAFNTGKPLNVVAAERLSQGIVVGLAGENADYELKYEGEFPEKALPNVDIGEELGSITVKEDAFRDRMFEILTELYNVAWSRGVSAIDGLDPEARRAYVASRVDDIMHEVYAYEP